MSLAHAVPLHLSTLPTFCPWTPTTLLWSLHVSILLCSVLHVSDLCLSLCLPSESRAQEMLCPFLAQVASDGPGVRAAPLVALS